MAIRVALHHKTDYRYDRSVSLLPQVIRLRPAPHCRTPILSYSLKVKPAEHFLNWQQDPYSNYLARLVFRKPTQSFEVEVDLVAEMTALNPFEFFIESSAEKYPFPYEPTLAKELVPYLEKEPAGPLLVQYVATARRDKVQTIDYLVDLNQDLHRDIKYVIRMEPGIQTCEETLAKRSGSCRDSAWLLVQILRHLGLAARFVSGYLIQLTADVPALDGPSGPAHDFTDLHAWAEVYLPGAGWIGLDPTSGLLAGEGHLPLACAADPTSAAPITGAFQFDGDPRHGDADDLHTDFHFHMAVTRIHEDPRVTKPYTEEAWLAIEALGHFVDQKLIEGDVRLTMGGEPTFVSIDDRDGPEWTTAAVGPHKRRQADVLLRRLRDRFAPGGLLHFGQGKWYPGESLPRWAFGCYWRTDGIPIWNDAKLVAEDTGNYGYGPDDAHTLVTHLAKRLGVEATHAMPAYEDTWYYLWRERRLPVNVDPFDNKLEEEEDRRRLAHVFDQGLKTAAGYALPLRRCRESDRPHWQSGPWFLRREHLFLIPGDSPMGYRLPLDSVPWETPEARDRFIEPDPFAPRDPLPTKAELMQKYFRKPEAGPSAFYEVPGRYEPAGQTALVRTALCVEARQGRLYVFMPPQAHTEDYLDLIAAVEATARALFMPVQMEGYPPPHDPRLAHFKITPDPGVLEVNVQPAANWSQLVHHTTTLYEEARQARLCAEKFMLDGRHTGTAGGNHIVLGGPTPAESPILRRPDLLRSLIAYWHNHPSLSYLFSGLFLGPTSQAPRVDEARNDSLYEMEIAFQQIPENGPTRPWLVDRVFRHLLTDVTGNTHRAEFCIDKLFSPDNAGGRMGLVEFRAFEMPPHARMSLVQHLLLRSLIAYFWTKPYRHKLARWGTELHDRFMLPHFVDQDFDDVLTELRAEGYAVDKAWFAPHYEFRFPVLGRITQRGVDLELRTAIEPWHVLGEEPGGGGTVRYVDSSVERLQVKVRGMTDTRHVVTCNGRRLPLFPTGINGEFVAGVRYRAWQPPSCLHPTVPVHAPLVFDIVDTWMERSVGGCTYHVAHPGGRHHERFPVNAGEAEGRRSARFFPIGHTPGSLVVWPEEVNPDSPLTLDLRRQPPTGPKAVFTTKPYSRNGTLTSNRIDLSARDQPELMVGAGAEKDP
jgi:uncharacterized protein (DUF2126 family)/transglutaminase-like putative cysteine protease